MNKRILFSLIFLFLCLTQGFANPIDVNTAQNIAKSFIKKSATNAPARSKSSSSPELSLAYTGTSQESLNSYYVFNRENKNGFIIVSGDDRVSSVLGYADSGSFDYDNIPDNFKYWLECYQKAIENLSGNLVLLGVNANETSTTVEPLLGNINYNQDAPYNDLCPEISAAKGRAVTGCVATAMSQIMRYHRYPVKGIGNHSYTTKNLALTLSADFANTTYDWDNMLETYQKGKYTDKQANAIATLLYHCGVAVNMNYGTSSSASDTDIPVALVDYFNYDASTIKLCQRDYYNSSEWTELIKSELDQQRPVIYNGLSMGGGHSFVCDGYDANNYFHINWGWNNHGNAYFNLDVLDPSTEGIGGGFGGYSIMQSVIAGIQPLSGEQKEKQADLKLYSGCELQNSSFTMSLINYGIGTFEGYIGLLTQQGDDVTFMNIAGKNSIENGYGIKGTIDLSDFHYPEGVSKIYVAYKLNLSDEEYYIIKGKQTDINYIIATTTNGKTTFSSNAVASIKISNFKVLGELVTGENGKFEFTVQNIGDEEFNSPLRIVLVSTSSTTNNQIVSIEGEYIAGKETQNIQFESLISLKAGQYKAYLDIYNPYSPNNINPISTITVDILNEHTNISENTVSTIQIYPNPASSTLNIHTDEMIMNIEVLDLSGKIVLTVQPGNTNDTTINIGALPTGTYLVRVNTIGNTIVQKIIKQ